MNIPTIIQNLHGYSVSNRPRLTDAQFTAFTASLALMTKHDLPAPYLAFVRDYGAFAVDATVKDRHLPVAVFLGATLPTDAYDLRRAFEIFRGRIPDGTLPIALDDYGSMFVMDFNTSAVSFFDHETEQIQAVAPDFDSFLEVLEPLPDDDLDE